MNPGQGGNPGASGGDGVGKAAAEMMQEMEQAQKDSEKAGKLGQPGQFQNVLNSQETHQVSPTLEIQRASTTSKAINVLQQAQLNANLPSNRVGAAERAKESMTAKMLGELLGGQDRMAGIMKIALSGRQMAPQELLAMQAGVYRYSQELELTSKVVEKVTSGVKQTMNTQV